MASGNEDDLDNHGSSHSANAEASVGTSNHVYVWCDEHAWIPARVVNKTHNEEENSNSKKKTKQVNEANLQVVSIPRYRNEMAIQSDGGRSAIRFETKKIDKSKYANGTLPLQNVNAQGQLTVVEDMVDLSFLHEAAILYNLKARHVKGMPYTRTGDIVIACNPYQWHQDLYTEERKRHYSRALVWSRNMNESNALAQLPPHVYETGSLAYRGLSVDGQPQSILVSGESGAGKTETVKILMNDLASIQASRLTKGTLSTTNNAANSVVQRVLDSNPLLEAFGNAKTSRNDNSSRFGKYIQLQFECEDARLAAYTGKAVPACVLAGSKSEVYLLEKSRVISHNEELERTFHIFYQLLAADEQLKCAFWEGLQDTDSESFAYVGWSDTNTIEGVHDSDRFQQTVDSLALIGVEGDILNTLMRAICIVLCLGNLVFDQSEQNDEQADITSTDELQEVSELMAVEPDDLKQAFTLRTVKARGETYHVPLNAVKAKESCDAFAKEIYAKTFLWLVRTINDATCAEKNYPPNDENNDNNNNKKKPKRPQREMKFGTIGLLDIFGFESFEVNRFEQLCINYANEKLQQKFTQDIFRSVQAEYEYEGIALGEIRYDDNTEVLDLIEGRMGLIAFLNEECVRPQGSDSAFVSKVAAMNRDSTCFVAEKHFSAFEFGVIHYAGKVIYDADAFVNKNMDNLPSDLQECATKSSNAIIARELANESIVSNDNEKGGGSGAGARRPKKKPPAAAAARRGSGSGATSTAKKGTASSASSSAMRRRTSNIVAETVWTKFKNQLTSLMANLNATRTRYIRCIKPNTMKKPKIMQHMSTVEQLRCAGVVAAVTISRSAFPNRLEHELVLDRFKSLWQIGDSHQSLFEVEETEEGDDAMSTTTTGTVLTTPEQARNKKAVDALLTAALISMQTQDAEGNIVKAFVIGRTRTYFRAGALECLESQRLVGLNTWATEVQRVARGMLVRIWYTNMKRAAIVLQAWFRYRAAAIAYAMLHHSTICVQCWNRCLVAKRVVIERRRHVNATKIQTFRRGILARRSFKAWKAATIVVQAMLRGALQRPKYRQALHEKKEEAKLENQLRALQRKLEEAEQKRLEAEEKAEAQAKQAVEEYATQQEQQQQPAPQTPQPKQQPEEPQDEKKEVMESHDAVVTNTPVSAAAAAGDVAAALPALPREAAIPSSISLQQQQTLMDESGKMLEYLRKEVFKLRSANAQMRADFDLLKDNNQRLMDANASAGASFAALNQHAKQLSKTNSKLTHDVQSYKQQVQKLNVLTVELKEELKMKQATYIAEVHSRLQYQKALTKMVDSVQERCRDTRLVEDVLALADECEADYMKGPADTTPRVASAATASQKRSGKTGASTTPMAASSQGGGAANNAATPNKGISSIFKLW